MENIKVQMCPLTSKGQGKCVGEQGCWCQNTKCFGRKPCTLFSRTCKHLHWGYESTHFPIFFLFSPPLSIFSSNPHYTGSVCCSILVSAVCYSNWSAFLLLQRNCVQRDKDSESTCLHWGGGGRRGKVTDTTWRAKGWLIRKLAEIIAGLGVVFAALECRALWMWDGSHSNLDARWGQRSSVGWPVTAAVGL